MALQEADRECTSVEETEVLAEVPTEVLAEVPALRALEHERLSARGSFFSPPQFGCPPSVLERQRNKETNVRGKRGFSRSIIDVPRLVRRAQAPRSRAGWHARFDSRQSD